MNNILQNCFNCQNRIQCWHVKEELPVGRDPRKFKVNKYRLLKYFVRNTLNGSYNTLFHFEYFCIRSVIDMLNPSLSKEISNAYTRQCMGMIESMVNAQGTGWCCPCDDKSTGDDFKFVEIDQSEVKVSMKYRDSEDVE